MFESVLGRLVNGALWGLGAGLALTLLRTGEPGLRPVVKSAVKVYLTAAERVQELTAEARESLEDLYAEVQAEQHRGHPTTPVGESPESAGRR